MKRLLFVVLFALTFCFTASAYVGIEAGYGMWTLGDSSGDDLEPSNISLNLVFGKAISAVRIEGTIGTVLAGEDDGWEYSNINTMFNLYYDIKVADKIAVYPTAGVGFVINTLDHDIAEIDASIINFAWQVGLGARYNISDWHGFDLTFRYINAGEPEYHIVGGADLPVETTAMQISLGYKFGF